MKFSEARVTFKKGWHDIPTQAETVVTSPHLKSGELLKIVKAYLKENPGSTAAQILEGTGHRWVIQSLSKYVERRYIKRTGSIKSRYARYWLKSQSTQTALEPVSTEPVSTEPVSTEPFTPVAYYCPTHEEALQLRFGNKGKFWGCPTYQETGCRFTKPHKKEENKNGPVTVTQGQVPPVNGTELNGTEGHLKWLQDEVMAVAGIELMKGEAVSLKGITVLQLIDYEKGKVK